MKEKNRTYSIIVVSFCLIVMLTMVYVNLPLLWIKKANKSIENGDLNTALTMFSRVIKYSTVNIFGHEDDQAKGYYGRGRVYERMKEYGKAIDDYDQYLALRSSPAEVFYHRGYCYLMIEDYSTAVSDFSRCIEEDGTNSAAYYYQGFAHEKMESVEMALESYLKACERGSPEGCNDYNRLLKEVKRGGGSSG
ncbi:MAG: tetratricopeptide repeat protein [Deltaproteobacteria bacterium]|nr:tetratricopeptide repeat protein [Candidatus Zymogenaceae bacterium]